MSFPSISTVAGSAGRTFYRFPLAILLAIKGTLFGIILSHKLYRGIESGGTEIKYYNIIISCYLGMLLSVALTILAEKWKRGLAKSRWTTIVLQLVVVILAGLYYLTLPPAFSSWMLTRSIVLALGLHWLIAVIGFGRGEVNGFWLFNKRLFLRVLTSYLYTAVLIIGLLLALAAIGALFKVDIPGWAYDDITCVLWGIFSVWFFLAGFPRDYDNPTIIADYPKGLKIFTQYVLLTLVTIYLLILYAYMFTIIFSVHWPVGWVGWLVMAFSVVGVLSLLLIYPLRNDQNNAWIRHYSTFFYFALLPLIVLLFCAIEKRLAAYGITQQRYFLLVLALWLLGMTIYFLVSRQKDIRLVPLSLCIIAFLSCFGPWNAFEVSLHSQRGRLERLLQKNGLMTGHKVILNRQGVKVSLEDRKGITSVITYLIDGYGYHILQPLFNENLDIALQTGKREYLEGGVYWQTNQIMQWMNVPYTREWETDETNAIVGDVSMQKVLVKDDFDVYPLDNDTAIAAEGFQYAQPDMKIRVDSCRIYPFGRARLQVCLDGKTNQLRMMVWAGDRVRDSGTVDLDPVARRIKGKGYPRNVPRKELILPIKGQVMTGQLIISRLSGCRCDTSTDVLRVEGMIFFSWK